MFIPIGFLLALFVARDAHAIGDYPPSLVKYLAYVDQLTTVEYDVQTSLGPTGSTPIPTTAGRLVYFFDSGNSYFRSDPTLDRRGSYVEALQDGARFLFNVEAKQGTVSREKLFWPLLPINLIGMQISHCAGDNSGAGIREIVERKLYGGTIDELDSNGFVIRSIFASPSSTVAQDLFVILDPMHQNCPRRILISSQKPGEAVALDSGFNLEPRLQMWLFETEEYASEKGIDVPVKVSCKGPGMVSLSVCELQGINAQASAPETYKFPEDSFWVDKRDGSKHGDESIVDKWIERVAKTQTNEGTAAGIAPAVNATYANAPWSSSSYVYWWILLAGITIVLAAFLLGRRRSGPLAILFFASNTFLLTGCDIKNDGPNAMKGQPLATKEPVVVVNFGLREDVMLKEVEVDCVNQTEGKLVLPKTATTSCGCSEARWTKGFALRGETVPLRVKINRPQIDSPREVFVTSNVYDSNGKELGDFHVLVNIVTDQEWMVQERALIMQHGIGEAGVGKLTVKMRSTESVRLVAKSPVCDLLEFKEIEGSDSIKELVFRSQACRELVNDSLLGEVVIEATGLTPESISVTVLSKVRVPYTLSRRVLLYPKNNKVRIGLEPGWSVTSVSVTSEKADATLSQESGENELQIRNCSEESFQCFVVCNIAKENLSMEVRIPAICN